jgi:phosphatidylethanolamine-binding protein (PEBP) family uncharacterized protein
VPLFRWLGVIYSVVMARRITYWLTVTVLAALCIAALYFNFSDTASDDRPSFSVRFSWVGIPACKTISPAFELGGVPASTKSLSFMMTDLNMPSFHHGGSTVPFSGNLVRQGAITYTGPCPPRAEHHTYRWTVQALDGAGKVLGKTTADASFPST